MKTAKLSTIQLFHKLRRDIDYSNQPYLMDSILIYNDLAMLIEWQKHPKHDCLRARGDWRWLKSLELESELQSLLKPF